MVCRHYKPNTFMSYRDLYQNIFHCPWWDLDAAEGAASVARRRFEGALTVPKLLLLDGGDGKGARNDIRVRKSTGLLTNMQALTSLEKRCDGKHGQARGGARTPLQPHDPVPRMCTACRT